MYVVSIYVSYTNHMYHLVLQCSCKDPNFLIHVLNYIFIFSHQWRYTVRVHNFGDAPVRLRSRLWRIHSGPTPDGKDPVFNEIFGRGVGGEVRYTR